MRGLLETRDLTGGEVATPPSCLRLAPEPAAVADLLHDESRMMAAGVASVAEPATIEELRSVLRWHAHPGHPVTVSGARTGVVGGAVPETSTHLVSVARLRGVIELDLLRGEQHGGLREKCPCPTDRTGRGTVASAWGDG